MTSPSMTALGSIQKTDPATAQSTGKTRHSGADTRFRDMLNERRQGHVNTESASAHNASASKHKTSAPERATDKAKKNTSNDTPRDKRSTDASTDANVEKNNEKQVVREHVHHANQRPKKDSRDTASPSAADQAAARTDALQIDTRPADAKHQNAKQAGRPRVDAATDRAANNPSDERRAVRSVADGARATDSTEHITLDKYTQAGRQSSRASHHGFDPADKTHARDRAQSAEIQRASRTADARQAGINREIDTAAEGKTLFDARSRLASGGTGTHLKTGAITANGSGQPGSTTTLFADTLAHGIQTGVQSHVTAGPVASAGPNATTLTGVIDAAPGTAQWQQAMTQQSLRLIHRGGGQAELTLHPPSLGKLHVSLQMGHDAQMHFASPHADVRAAVQSALPQLKAAFADAGLTLGQTSVGEQNQPHSQTGGRDDAPPRTAAIDTEADNGDQTADAARITRIAARVARGGIDLFA